MENRIVFNDAQLHVLEMASRIKTRRGLEELKDQLAEYYARRIDEDMEALWQSGVWTVMLDFRNIQCDTHTLLVYSWIQKE